MGGKLTVLLDSGLRGGAGQRGVQEVVRNFMADFDLSMGLAGCRTVPEIDRTMLVEA